MIEPASSRLAWPPAKPNRIRTSALLCQDEPVNKTAGGREKRFFDAAMDIDWQDSILREDDYHGAVSIRLNLDTIVRIVQFPFICVEGELCPAAQREPRVIPSVVEPVLMPQFIDRSSTYSTWPVAGAGGVNYETWRVPYASLKVSCLKIGDIVIREPTSPEHARCQMARACWPLRIVERELDGACIVSRDPPGTLVVERLGRTPTERYPQEIQDEMPVLEHLKFGTADRSRRIDNYPAHYSP
jgi:hypothetical protein